MQVNNTIIIKGTGKDDAYKTIDELGPIVTPCPMRQKCNLVPKTELEIAPTRKGMFLKPVIGSIYTEPSVKIGNAMILADPLMYAFLSDGAELAGVTPKECLLRLNEILEYNSEELLALLHKDN